MMELSQSEKEDKSATISTRDGALRERRQRSTLAGAKGFFEDAKRVIGDQDR